MTVSEDFIVSSPYFDSNHLLNLKDLTEPFRILALALQNFEPIDSRYASQRYDIAFDLERVRKWINEYIKVTGVKFPQTSAYIIAFRSILKDEVTIDPEKRAFLSAMDKESHMAANLSGGLLKYWFGVPDTKTNQNLATCWWLSKAEAKRGGNNKPHQKAVMNARSWYILWRVEEYEFTLSENAVSYSFVELK